MTKRASTTIAAAAVALLLAACSSTVDSAELEEEIKTQLETQVGEELESVDCPEDISADEGDTFTCTLTDRNDTTLDVNGTFTDADGNFEVEVAGG